MSFISKITLLVFDSYYAKTWIKSFYNKEPLNLKPIEIFLCPVNALEVDGNKVFKKENCIACNLCELKYIRLKNLDMEVPALSDYFMTDIKRLCIVLKYLYPNSWSACEVKVKGNYRNKRIDIVWKKGENIYIFKVLSNLDDYSLYLRSYKEIMNYLIINYPNHNTHLRMLVRNLSDFRLQVEKELVISYAEVIGEEVKIWPYY